MPTARAEDRRRFEARREVAQRTARDPICIARRLCELRDDLVFRIDTVPPIDPYRPVFDRERSEECERLSEPNGIRSPCGSEASEARERSRSGTKPVDGPAKRGRADARSADAGREGVSLRPKRGVRATERPQRDSNPCYLRERRVS